MALMCEFARRNALRTSWWVVSSISNTDLARTMLKSEAVELSWCAKTGPKPRMYF